MSAFSLAVISALILFAVCVILLSKPSVVFLTSCLISVAVCVIVEDNSLSASCRFLTSEVIAFSLSVILDPNNCSASFALDTSNVISPFTLSTVAFVLSILFDILLLLISVRSLSAPSHQIVDLKPPLYSNVSFNKYEVNLFPCLSSNVSQSTGSNLGSPLHSQLKGVKDISFN